MKKEAISLMLFILFLVPGLFLLSFSASGQQTSKESPSLPDSIDRIVSVSCVPCHTSKGGLMSRSKLNFTVWTQYSTAKQKERAGKMYSMLKKGDMPPKSARETRPEIIPANEQIDVIKNWAESLKSDDK